MPLFLNTAHPKLELVVAFLLLFLACIPRITASTLEEPFLHATQQRHLVEADSEEVEGAATPASEEPNSKSGGTSNFYIPGATQTEDGYDTEFGRKAICWKSWRGTSTDKDQLIGLGVKNVLTDFGIDNDDAIRMMTSCPSGNTLVATAPPERVKGEGRLRTGTWYTYKVNVTLDLTSLDGQALVSDEIDTTTTNTTHTWTLQKVAVQVIVCKLGAGFCSPFVHEIANAKLKEQGLPLSPARGDLHGGTHVHSPATIKMLAPEEGPRYAFQVEVPMLVNDPNALFGVAVAQMFISSRNSTNHAQADLRFDMANALMDQQRLLNYQAPAEILTIPRQLEIVNYVLLTIVGGIILFLLASTIRHRRHQILTLTQGYFLMVFLAAALVASVSTFLLEPVSTLYCRLGLPIILISLQLMYAITVGRLWRINAVISPLLVQSMAGKHRPWWWCLWTQILKLSERLDCLTMNELDHSEAVRSIRKQFTHRQLALVVAVFTLPQVVVQLLAAVLQPPELIIEYNSDESVGRPTCSTGVDNQAHVLVNYGIGLLLCLLVVLLCMAHATRQLPSLFNETKLIFDSTLSSLILACLGGAIILVTRSPTTNPAVEYLIWSAVVLSMTLQGSLRIMLPKLRMAWKNETVLVSTLVSDHARKMRNKSNNSHTAGSSGSGDRVHITGLSFPGRDSLIRASEVEPLHISSSGISSGLESTDAAASERYNIDEEEEAFDDVPLERGTSTKKISLHPVSEVNVGRNTIMTEHSETEGETVDVDRNTFVSQISRVDEDEATDVGHQHPTAPKRKPTWTTYVSKDKAPSKRLVLKMLDLQSRLANVNERVMTGLSVSEEDWTLLRAAMKKMGHTFERNVRFEWEQQQDDLQQPDPLGQMQTRHQQRRGRGRSSRMVGREFQQSASVLRSTIGRDSQRSVSFAEDVVDGHHSTATTSVVPAFGSGDPEAVGTTGASVPGGNAQAAQPEAPPLSQGEVWEGDEAMSANAVKEELWV